jgi:glucose-1-phosphate cytidylyltransferase
MITYGDGVSNIDLQALLEFHRKRGKLVTVSAVRPPARFGGLIFEGELVSRFTEKPQAGEGWINGGFLVCEPGIFDYLIDDRTSLERDMLERVANDRQLAAYRHEDFWQCMDTIRDPNCWNAGKGALEDMAESEFWLIARHSLLGQRTSCSCWCGD